MKISKHAIEMAKRLKALFMEKGYRFYIDSPTNQQFIILENEKMKALQKEVSFSFWENYDEHHTVVRFATSWSTTEEDIDELILAVEKCNHVKVKGIMVIIPKGDEVSNRYYFNKSKHIYDDLSKKNYKNIQMEILSMGMTSDFKIAIQEGANLIRIGSGIFGER